jgi:hypothetical protein
MLFGLGKGPVFFWAVSAETVALAPRFKPATEGYPA